MGKLGDIIGDEFEEEYEENRRKAEERRKKVSQETMMEICYEAINNGGFKGDEPRFRFEDGQVDHDVVLMESPQSQMDKFTHELGQSGGMSLGMFHMGDLWSCVFNDDMVEMIDKIEEDEYYVVVGRYTENIQNKGTDNEEKYINIAPVRGIVPIEVAKQYAEKYEDALSGTDENEQAQKQQQEASSSSSDDSASDEERIVEVFKVVGNKKPEVLEKTSEGDEDGIEALVAVVNDNTDDSMGREQILDVFEEHVEEIDGRGEEEEDDDMGIDTGSLMGDSDDEDEDNESESDDNVDLSDDSEDDTSESTSDDGGDGEEEEGVDSWF